jgi:tungstate transport system permease protein
MLDATLRAFALLFTGDPDLWRIIWVSLKTSVVGLLLATPLAVLLGYLVAMHRFRGRRIAIWLAQAALSLPTVLIGLLLYLLLSRHGPMGGLQWLFSQPGIIVGQFVVALPVLLAFTLAAVLSGFGRVISEVGCALMVGGNIEGETRTITTAIALETSKGDFSQGIALGIVLVSIALLMNGVLMLLQGDAHAARGRT